jgi:hypothetical protein
MGNRFFMKDVKIFSNANHEALQELAVNAINDPQFVEIHYSGHNIMVIYEVPDKKEKSLDSTK